jgi:hypothetical protein
MFPRFFFHKIHEINAYMEVVFLLCAHMFYPRKYWMGFNDCVCVCV